MKQIAEIVEGALEARVERKLATVAELEAELAADPEDGMKKYRVGCRKRCCRVTGVTDRHVGGLRSWYWCGLGRQQDFQCNPWNHNPVRS